MFVSYHHSDQSIADKIRLALASEGVDVWSPESIALGASIQEQVTAAIRDADYTLLLLGPTSQSSPYTMTEAAAAGSCARRIRQK